MSCLLERCVNFVILVLSAGQCVVINSEVSLKGLILFNCGCKNKNL